jgi:hypothetical protein
MKFLNVVLAALAAEHVSAKELWSSKPASYAPMRNSGYILKTGYLVGNGKLGGTAIFQEW